ncbi:MAG: hypothetical protein ACJA0P_003139 [Planctomycetota bacterium]|jgi:hypothetical protein
MFHLNEQVIAWCQSVHRNGSDRDARVDELADHVFCEIAQLTATGMSDEEAFLVATARMGKADDLAIEHNKNQGSLSKFGVVLLAMSCGSTERLRELVTRKQASALLLGVSLLVAAIMLGSALITKRSDQTFIWVLIAIWWIPFSTLSPIADGTVRSGCGQEA